jgi:hypothetical protein
MDFLPRFSQIDIPTPRYKKSVRFTSGPAEVHDIPSGMETWQNGDRALEVSENNVANAETLWKHSYALASAWEAQDAGGYFNATPVRASLKKLVRPATPSLQCLHREMGNSMTQPRPMPISTRAQTIPVQVGSSRLSSQTN